MNIEKCPGGPTREEVAAVALQKLGRNDVFLDIGCGTGLVSILANERFKEIYAIDRREIAVKTCKKNFDKHGVEGKVLKGEAPDILSGIPSPDAVFIGGSRNLVDVLNFLSETKVVISCARIETLLKAKNALIERNGLKDTLLIQVSKGYDLKKGTAFKAENPVFLVEGELCL